ncbi:hypothetical protein TrRE_jg1360 [Triparma retinervis]|uniref:Uncharacterized protein n=1 Tax=Triparma retinervis TaxID=2557542 RepID=A0A9W7APN6_9STRA|nr:hypothetical protein TrRE_jg1360 [Triparma retinervis]
MASVSIRGGKLQPSQRYKPKESFEMNQTSWRPGIDGPTFSTTYQAQTAQIANHTEPKVPFPRIDKNASDSRAIFGEANIPPARHFVTESRKRYNGESGVYSQGYERTRPKDGFDRETANRTNYSLGLPGEQGEWVSSTHALQMTHPASLSQPAQPNIGGWLTGPGGSYFKDIETYKNITRGGGGGEGNLGLEFNILTNQPDPTARSRISSIAGPRLSQDRANNHHRYSSGFERDERDIITGKPVTKYRAPMQPTKESLKRPD